MWETLDNILEEKLKVRGLYYLPVLKDLRNVLLKILVSPICFSSWDKIMQNCQKVVLFHVFLANFVLLS